MKIGLFYRLKVHDENGNPIKDTGLKPSHSYVIQFLELIEALFDSQNKDATDTLGSEERIIKTDEALSTKGRVDAPANDDDYGLLVGTNAGATAEDNENYNLDTKIAHGSGAGQLIHGETLLIAPRVIGAAVNLDVSRAFRNRSGGTITVKEIGIICENTITSKYFLLLRDVISDFDVDDTYTLTVVYSLQSTA